MGEVEDHLVAVHEQVHGNAAGLAVHRILVHVVGEEVLPVRDAFDEAPRLLLGVVQQVLDALAEGVDAEARDHLVDLALPRGHGRDLRLEIAPVLLGHAHVHQHHVDQLLVELAALVELRRREADAFLVHVDVRPREARRHRAAHVRVVDVSDREAHQLPIVEDGLPQVDVRGVGAHEPAVGVVGHAEIAFLVAVDEVDDAAVVQPDEPGGAQIVG